MKIRMTDRADHLGDVEGSLTEGQTVADVQDNFRAACETVAEQIGHEITWSNPDELKLRDDEEKEIADEIFKKSIEIGW
jgi:hypothetical protein